MGGLAGTATAPVAVFPGERLFVEIGGDGLPGNHGGWNGGGAEANNFRNFPAGAGGGASDVRTASCGSGCANGGGQGSLASRLVVAGGGGGGAEVGEGEGYDTGSSGGDGGSSGSAGTVGHNAETEEPAFGGSGGSGGSETAGGSGGSGGSTFGGSRDGNEGGLGAFGRGGNGGAAFESTQGAGGGGGGGWFGGGGGGGGGRAGSCCQASAGGGGGGGSSYAPGGATGIDTEGVPTSVRISYEVPAVKATSPVEFATQAEGTLSLPQAVTVTNEGEGPLVLSALTFAGAAPGDFVIAADSCLGQIEPAESCDVMVAFAPKAEGTRTATLEIASNDPSGPATVGLEGIGGAPPRGAPGPEGVAGAAGATGAGGSSGPAGPAGPAGATGAAGATGPAGASGATGASGQTGSTAGLDVMSCRTRATAPRTASGRARVVPHLSCRPARSSALTFRGRAQAAHTQLVRGGRIYAAGIIVQSAGGHAQLFLTNRKPVAPGPCTLVVARREHGRWTTVRLPAIVEPAAGGVIAELVGGI